MALERKRAPKPVPQPKTATLRREKNVVIAPADSNFAPATAARDGRKFVPLEQRRPGWPRLRDKTTADTEYDTNNGVTVHGFVTHCNNVSVGWDVCGACRQHVKHCHCPGGVSVPRGIVYIYRTRNGVSYPPEGPGGGPYIGLRHNADGSVAPMVVDTPMHQAQTDSGPKTTPKTNTKTSTTLVRKRKGNKT
jgi:hypothetical protein